MNKMMAPAFCGPLLAAMALVAFTPVSGYDYDYIDGGPPREYRDILFEQFVYQAVEEFKEIPTSPLDPLKMWPVKEIFAKKMYKGNIETCNMYLHNLKGLEIKELQVMRGKNMSTFELYLKAHLPSVWLTGVYSLTNIRLMRVMKIRNKIGKFNFDLNGVESELALTLHALKNGTVAIEGSKFSLKWKDVGIRFHNLLRSRQSTRSKITKLLLNQLGIGNTILKSKRDFINNAVAPFIKEIFRCVFNEPLDDIEACLNRWWEKNGIPDPWNWPVCNIPPEYLDAEIEP